MNIKEIIDAQRWSTLRDIDYRDGEIISNAHNKALILIEASVTEYIKELEAQIKELSVPVDYCVCDLCKHRDKGTREEPCCDCIIGGAYTTTLKWEHK